MSFIHPCFWMNNNVKQAVAYYREIFPDLEVLQQTPMVSLIRVRNQNIMLLNGGEQYGINPSLSLYLYCETREEIDRVYAALSHGGKVILPLDSYFWCPRYAWVEDAFGVHWQLDMDPINNAQKIVPCLFFSNALAAKVKEAMSHYISVFPNPMVLVEAPFPNQEGPEKKLQFAQFKLSGSIIQIISSPDPQDYGFTPGTSLVVNCSDQQEIDTYWESLGSSGKYSKCGWLEDRFGVSWQIMPKDLGHWMEDPQKAPKILKAIGGMEKIILDELS